eukprot:Clim_evm62s172 gene=Clim_evmTU62s172
MEAQMFEASFRRVREDRFATREEQTRHGQRLVENALNYGLPEVMISEILRDMATKRYKRRQMMLLASTLVSRSALKKAVVLQSMAVLSMKSIDVQIRRRVWEFLVVQCALYPETLSIVAKAQLSLARYLAYTQMQKATICFIRLLLDDGMLKASCAATIAKLCDNLEFNHPLVELQRRVFLEYPDVASGRQIPLPASRTKAKSSIDYIAELAPRLWQRQQALVYAKDEEGNLDELCSQTKIKVRHKPKMIKRMLYKTWKESCQSSGLPVAGDMTAADAAAILIYQSKHQVPNLAYYNSSHVLTRGPYARLMVQPSSIPALRDHVHESALHNALDFPRQITYQDVASIVQYIPVDVDDNLDMWRRFFRSCRAEDLDAVQSIVANATATFILEVFDILFPYIFHSEPQAQFMMAGHIHDTLTSALEKISDDRKLRDKIGDSLAALQAGIAATSVTSNAILRKMGADTSGSVRV